MGKLAVGRFSPGSQSFENYTVDRWRHEGWSDNPIYLVQDQRIIEGLRKAGLPEK